MHLECVIITWIHLEVAFSVYKRLALSAPTPKKVKQFLGNLLKNYLNVFDHSVAVCAWTLNINSNTLTSKWQHEIASWK